MTANTTQNQRQDMLNWGSKKHPRHLSASIANEPFRVQVSLGVYNMTMEDVLRVVVTSRDRPMATFRAWPVSKLNPGWRREVAQWIRVTRHK